MERKMISWCVNGKRGWCIVKGGIRERERAENIPTLCGYFIVLPFGVEKREPTCLECRQEMKRGDAA
jgi:hypothetical protein